MSVPRKARPSGWWVAVLAASAALLLGACCGYSTGPAGTTIQRVELGAGGGKPAPPAAARPIAAPAVAR